MLRERFVSLSVIAFGLIIGGFIIRGMTRATLGGEMGDLIAAPFIGGGFLLIVLLTIASILAYLGIGPMAQVVGDNS